MRERPLVLFLGNNYNPFSIACADAALQSDQCRVVIGIHDDVENGSAVGLLRTAVERYGWPFVGRRAWLLARARTRLALRRAGVVHRRPLSLDELAIAHGVRAFRCPRVSKPPTLDTVRALAPALILVGGFSQILRSTLLAIPPRGAVNVHPSVLPRYRGPNPLYWVLANGEPETGVTMHYMDEGIDSGAIVAQERFAIEAGDDERALLERASRVAQHLVQVMLPPLLRGTAPRTPQRAEDASYYPLPPRGASRL